MDQLADFLLQKPLSEDPCYDELVPSELRDLPKNRQTLLCEQGVLDVLIDVLKRIDVLVEQAALKKHGRNVSAVARKTTHQLQQQGSGGLAGKPRERRRSSANVHGKRRKSSVVAHRAGTG